MEYLIIFLSIFTLFNCKIEDSHLIKKGYNLLSEKQNIVIYVNSGTNVKVGTINGTFPFQSTTLDKEGFFDDSDIEANTYFDLQITSKKQHDYDLGCRLWKDSINYIAVFCNMKEPIIEDEEFEIYKTKYIKYNSKDVQIKFNYYSFKLYKIEGTLPFIYSKSQNYTIEENTKKIKMNFKLGAYNNEQLFLRKSDSITIIPIDCKKESNDLECEINKKDLDTFSKNEDVFWPIYLVTSGVFEYFDFVGSLKFNYQYIINKVNVYFEIESLINANIEPGSFIYFETNVTHLDKFKTSFFSLKIAEGLETKCLFINHDKLNKLYLSCNIEVIGTYHIGKIEGLEVNDIHNKYNFIFGTQIINKDITITTTRSAYVIYSYPETLDFTSKDSLSLYIFTSGAEYINNIRLNENGEDLYCTDIEAIKKCIVKKDHFIDKENRYYLIHHKNNEGKYVANYEDFGVNVIFNNPTPTDTPTDTTTDTPSKSGKINPFSFDLLALLFLLV